MQGRLHRPAANTDQAKAAPAIGCLSGHDSSLAVLAPIRDLWQDGRPRVTPVLFRASDRIVSPCRDRSVADRCTSVAGSAVELPVVENSISRG